MGFLKQRAKANVSLGKMRNAAKGYTEAIKEGKRLLRESKMKKADTEKLVSKLYVKRGEMHEQVEKYAEAIDDYKKALKIAGSDGHVSLALTRASKPHFQIDIEKKNMEKKNKNVVLPSLSRPGMKQFENRGKAGACF